MYNALKERVIYAKHLKRTHDLTVVEKDVVYYIYREILECIEAQKFRVPHFKNIGTARVDLFNINVVGGLIYINTIYHFNAEKVKAFKCEKANIGKSVDAIESAVKLVGLEFERPKHCYIHTEYTIYYLAKKEEIT